MLEKRYSIVRVEGCNEERLKLCPNMPTCAFCLYGDTKEQLIAKVAQVIRKRTDNGIIVRYREDSISVEELAKEIVEFLGVK